jgi:hypothetical protein
MMIMKKKNNDIRAAEPNVRRNSRHSGFWKGRR